MSRKKKKKNNNSKFISIILILLAFIYGSFFEEINTSFGLMYDNVIDNIENNTDTDSNNNYNEVSSKLKIYYLDVGQADSILIRSGEENMLIDAGNNNDGSLLVKYFEGLGIEEFKYVVGTHPHEDHIGGLDDIIENFDIETVFLPDAITTSSTFEDVLDAISNKDMTYTVPTIGDTYTLGEATIKVIYTGTDTTDLNSTSIVLKLTFGKTSYLFMGDLPSEEEEEILNSDISADVLKVGHHGSKYSTSDDFLEKVNPTYAIISVGKNNKYSHPSNSTISKLENKGISIYRTDESGTILIESDGENITINSFKTATNGG